jgi:hypothetical protein
VLPSRHAQLDLFAQAVSADDQVDDPELEAFEEDAGDEVDYGAQPFEQRVVNARDVAPPVTLAPASVFEMAAAMLKRGGRFGHADGFRDEPPPRRQRVTVERDGGVTRCVGAQYPANRWDAERHEQERIRRAKQRPPKPTRKAKTRSRKLLEIIGEPDDLE